MTPTIIVLIWAAYGVLGPVVLKGTSARHNAFAVWMHSSDSTGNYLPAVKVQEVGEWKLAKALAVLAALPGLLLTTDPISQLILTVIPMLLVDGLCRPLLDYAGHGAEIIAAERAGLVGYREAEIERMRLFDGRTLSSEQIDSNLRRWHWLAKIVFLLGK